MGDKPQQRPRQGAVAALRLLTALMVLMVLCSTSVLLAALDAGGGAGGAVGARGLTGYQLHVSVARDALARGWQRNFHRIAGIHWDWKHGAGLLPNETRASLAPLWHHTFNLPMSQLQRSLVYVGPNARLRRVLRGLAAGQATKVGVIGGSISHGAKASVIGRTDWFSLVGGFLRQAYPAANITLRNGCLPATPSALMDMCLEQSIDADVDLLFIEYVANDGANRFDETKAKVYERLLRKTLQQAHKPAVVLMQLMPKGAAFGPGHREKLQYFHTLEDAYGALAQYYDTPWLSWRNAMWRLGELHRYGYNWTDFMWDADFMHPLDAGHKAIADVAVYLLQQTALQVAAAPYGIPDLDLLQEPMPPPMFPNNHEGRNRLCVYGEAFRSHVAGASGWAWLDEGKPGKRKWGYISTTPGSVLTIKLDTRRTSAPAPGADGGRMNVMLAYLKSYVSMGQAVAACVSGCRCEPAHVDGHHELRQSTVFLARLLPTEAADCVISVTLLKNTTSGKHKFKVSGIMQNEYTGSDVTTRVHEEQWLHQMLTINDPNAGAAPAGSNRSSLASGQKQQKAPQQRQQQQRQPQQQQQSPHRHLRRLRAGDVPGGG